MIGRVFAFILFAFSIGGAGLYWGSRNRALPVRRERWIKFATYVCVIHVVLVCALLGPRVLVAMFFLIFLIGAIELDHVLRRLDGRRVLLRAGISVAYFLLGLGLLSFFSIATKEMAIFVYLVVATFDGFSQVVGNVFGTHPLTPKISPGKTIEGTLGGLFFALVMAGFLHPLVRMPMWHSLAAGTWIVAAGFLGDLLASSVKRASGVKDFGRILPGHGGVLDRFDSLLVAAPAALLILYQSVF